MSLLTPAQAEDQFNISKASLRRWEEDGLITAHRTPGGHRRYDPAQLASLHKAPQAVAVFDNRPTGRDLYRELGSSGLTRFGGSVLEEPLRHLKGASGRKIYRQMRLNDPIIAAMFFAISQAMRQVEWTVTPASEKPADKEAAEFVETCLNDMSFSWHDTFTFIIDPMLEQGFSLLELCYKRRLGENPRAYTPNPAPSKYDDGRVGWRKWGPRPAMSLAPGAEWIFDEHGGIQGVNQINPVTWQTNPIPMEKLLHFRTTVHPANTPEPPPIHRPAYWSYFYSQNLIEVEGIGAERDLNGIPVIYLGNDRSYSGTNSDYELAKNLVTNLRRDEQTGVVFPGPKMGQGAPEGQGWLLELISTTNARTHDTTAIIERHDKRKALVVLAQFIMLGMEQVGSYALSRHQGDLFTMAVSAWLDSIADIINRHAITRLMRLNTFDTRNGLPELMPGQVGVVDLMQLADYVNKLVDKAVLTPDEELERHLRQVAGLPEHNPATVIEPAESEPEEPESEPEADDEPLIEAEKVAKHHGERVHIPCPFCGAKETELYKDHGSNAVCPDCLMTFSPDYHYGGQYAAIFERAR